MATNPYFNKYQYTPEQILHQDLIIEAIKNFGIDVYYLPRTIVNKDEIYLEDTISDFNASHLVEMYIKTVDGFEGEGDFISRFGLEIRDQVVFSVARRRFDNLEIENYTRPKEGDLIFLPLNKKLYEIRYVEHESVFYQFGKLPIFDLTCELMQYDGQKIRTGINDIDKIERENTYVYEYQYETGDTATATATVTDYLISDITVTSGGSYYYTVPTVTISDPDLSSPITATASATRVGGTITELALTNKGIYYTSAPSIYISSPGEPVTATATAILTNGVVTGATITNIGSFYTSNPSITVSEPTLDRQTATATATVVGNAVSSISITNGGKFYTSNPTVTVSFPEALYYSTLQVSSGTYSAYLTEIELDLDTGEGTDSVGTVIFDYYYNGTSTPTSGYLYQSENFNVKWVADKTITIEIRNLNDNNMDEIITNQSISIASGAGWNTFEFSWNGTTFSWWTTPNGSSRTRDWYYSYFGNSNYENQIFLENGQFTIGDTTSSQFYDNVKFYDDASVYNGSAASSLIFTENFEAVRATATATVTDGEVTSISILDAGDKYINYASITISDPTGTAEDFKASATAAISDGVLIGITISEGGKYYTSVPILTIAEPTGTYDDFDNINATATSAISSYGYVSSTTVTNSGKFYLSDPTITFDDPTGTISNFPTTAIATINATSAKVDSISITGGYGYTSTPTITIADPDSNFTLGETLIGLTSGSTGELAFKDSDSIKVMRSTNKFTNNELIQNSNKATIKVFGQSDEQVFVNDDLAQNFEIEREADDIIDFSESNPFSENNNY